MPPQRTKGRNRATCTACQISKRKCDLNKPSCSRCVERKIPCVPSKQARWKVMAPSQDTTAAEVTVENSSDTTPAGSLNTVRNNENQPQDLIFEGPRDESSNSLSIQLEMGHGPLASDTYNFMASEGPSLLDDTTSNCWVDLFQNLDSMEQPTGQIDLIAGNPNTSAIPGNALPPTARSEIPADTSPRTILTRYIPPQVFSDTVTPYLWNTFVTEIVAELTPSGNGQGNPLLRYLASRAREEPGLFASVLFLSLKVIENRDSSSANYNKGGLTALGVALEQQATHFLDAQTIAPSSDALILGQLSTMVTLCAAYIAQGRTTKIEVYLENALILVQSVFKRLQTNETFLFMIKWLGYIHATAMLSNGKYDIRAPDYISICKNFQAPESTAHNAALSLRGNMLSEDVPSIFLDVDDFLGISAVLLTLYYKLGRLYRMRHAAAKNMEGSRWFWQDFQAEADDLNARIEQQLYLAERPMTVDKPSDLDNYNKAFLHTLKLVFETDVRGSPPTNREGEEIVGEILDFCAAIPIESVVAKLCVLPLFHAGMRSTRRLHREFVQTRLTALMNYFLVTNVAQALRILQAHWASAEKGGKRE